MTVRIEASTIARCRPEHIWEKFQKLEQWPWWNPVISRAQWLQGAPWQKGSRFLLEILRPRRMSFKPVVLECSPPNRLAWMGKGLGIRGEHWFSFELQSDGSTLIKTWESFSGPLLLFVGKGTREAITRMFGQWLEHLKAEAEKLAREEFSRSA
jgi:hypothetical protein